MSAGHTPAPWDVTSCMSPDDGTGGVYYRVRAEGIDASVANARLIAAAPKLLMIAQDGERLIAGDLTGIEWKRECRAFLEAARAAIAEATTP